MTSEAGDDDKQYDASQKKLEDARKKGEIAKSADLTTAAGYAGLLTASLIAGPSALLLFSENLAGLIEGADSISDGIFDGGGMPFATAAFAITGSGYAPWAIIPGIFAILAVVAQRGLVFAPSKLAPKVSRISPLAGFANKFGREGLFEFLKSATKLTIFSAMLAIFLVIQFPRIMETLTLTPALIAASFLSLTLDLLFIVLIVAAAIGAIDFIWQSSQHQRKNRMSRKELTDEQKESEGDPMMKHLRRQKAISIAMNQMLADVPSADVIIVNPTHYAVALKWDRLAGQAPVCVAKGVDEVAARIRQIADTHSIAVHSDPPTARALFATVDIGQEIAPDHYRAVAAAIRFADSLGRKVRYS